MTSPKPTTTERLARFEAAQETLGMMIAIRARRIRDERRKSLPDENLIRQWQTEQNQFADEEDALGFDDDEGIERVLTTYGPVVKAEFARSA